jgi:hypothetical protein
MRITSDESQPHFNKGPLLQARFQSSLEETRCACHLKRNRGWTQRRTNARNLDNTGTKSWKISRTAAADMPGITTHWRSTLTRALYGYDIDYYMGFAKKVAGAAGPQSRSPYWNVYSVQVLVRERPDVHFLLSVLGKVEMHSRNTLSKETSPKGPMPRQEAT